MSSEEVLKFLGENECVAIAKFPDSMGQDGLEKNKILCGTALKLRFDVMSSDESFVIVNIQHSPDFIEKISKITTALGCECSVASDAETVAKMAEQDWRLDSWNHYGNMGKWAIDLTVKDFMEKYGLCRANGPTLYGKASYIYTITVLTTKNAEQSQKVVGKLRDGNYRYFELGAGQDESARCFITYNMRQSDTMTIVKECGPKDFIFVHNRTDRVEYISSAEQPYIETAADVSEIFSQIGSKFNIPLFDESGACKTAAEYDSFIDSCEHILKSLEENRMRESCNYHRTLANKR